MSIGLRALSNEFAVMSNSLETQTVFLQYTPIVTVNYGVTIGIYNNRIYKTSIDNLNIYKKGHINAVNYFGLHAPVLAQLMPHNMRSISRLGVLASGLLISLTSVSVNASSLITQTEPLDYQLPTDIQALCAESVNCPEIEVSYVSTNHPWLNERMNARINESMVNSKLTEATFNKKTVHKKDVTAAIDDFVRPQFQDITREASWAYNLMVTPTYLGHIEQFELFEINTYVFTGGAHGMPSQEYLMFDLNDHSQVTLEDMLQTGKKAQFETLAYQAYKSWASTVTDDITSYEKSWPFMLNDNITLTATGIDIRYQPYAIGPYAYGMPVLSIPYEALEGIIKPYFLPK